MIRRGQLLMLLFVLISITHNLNAQEENIWVLSYHNGLDFNSGNPIPIQTGNNNSYQEANASVCDAGGSLLFYTEGSYVWDRNGNLMPNGSDLTGLITSLNFSTVTYSSTQGALIIPYPDHDSLYFVFSLTDVEAGPCRLYYSVVDMSLNGGLGDVIPGMKGVFVDSMLTESITATVGDHCNIWLISRSTLFQQFRIYEITASGLNTAAVVSPAVGSGFLGNMAVSGSRKKLAVTTSGSYGLYLYDFDPATGMPSNPIALRPFTDCRGVAFSPDNTKLYAFTNDGQALYQYDISSGNSVLINNSEVQLGTAAISTQLKLGPNGKIYFFSPGDNSVMGVINQPNLPGSACGFDAEAVSLLNAPFSYSGLPNVVPVIPHDTFLSRQQVMAPCFASQVAVKANDDSTGWDYVWSTGSTGTMISADSPGVYWVSYHTPPCNWHADTFHVGFPDGVLPNIHVDTACAHAGNGHAYASTYFGDTVNYHYTWMNAVGDTLSATDTLNDVASGSYTVHIRTVHCDTMLSFFVPETDYSVSFLADSIICMGDALTFQNTSDSHFTQFHWYFGDGDSSLLQYPIAHPYPDAGNYQVMLTGTGAICSDTALSTIIVDSMLSGTFFTDPDSICNGRTIRFLPQTDSTTTALHWAWGDGTEMSGPNERSFRHAYDSAGALQVQLRAAFRACPDTSFIATVYVYVLPKVNLGPDTSLCLDGSPIRLQNQEPEPPAAHHYLWNTGDTTASLRVVHPGTYSLTISNEPLGCSTTESVEITKDCNIDIPNAFTPNGDGENDYFFPRQLLSSSLTGLRMQVLNRWGQVVFETMTTDGRGWDGAFNGKPQPQGVYIYLVDADFVNGRKESYKGNVTLLR